MMTKSPTLKFRLCFSHFWRSCNLGSYSFTQRAQNSFAKICTRFHLAWNLSESSNSLGAEHGLCRSNKMWLGVKGSKSPGSLDTLVIGLLFRIFSTSTRNVTKVSSLTRCSPIIAWRTMRSQPPPPPLVTGCWWIEVPLNVPSKQLTSNPLLVPSLQRAHDISLRSSKV